MSGQGVLIESKEDGTVRARGGEEASATGSGGSDATPPSSSFPTSAGDAPKPVQGFVKREPSPMTYPIGFSLQQGDPTGVAPWALGGATREPHVPKSGLLMPVPLAYPVVPLPPDHVFQMPVKKITSKADIDKFHESTAGNMFLGFIVLLSQAVEGKKLTDECQVSERLQRIIDALQVMSGWVDEIPPLQAAGRYGNPAYRTVQCTCKMCRLLPEHQKPRYGDPAFHQWFDRLEQEGPELIKTCVPPELHEAVSELFAYFEDSFGNRIRIDYGTGHEANFVAWLLCLARLGILTKADYQAVVTRVFVTYLDLMRKLQLTYWLEPAGSHGVWGLDDYCFLPFIFGAAQLTTHKYLRPKSVLNDDILEGFSKDYLYFAAVAFIKKVKKGALAEHSPMINDITAVPNWKKVAGGMLKMYKAEVLEKVPIMQHFLFGSIIKWEEDGKGGT